MENRDIYLQREWHVVDLALDKWTNDMKSDKTIQLQQYLESITLELKTNIQNFVNHNLETNDWYNMPYEYYKNVQSKILETYQITEKKIQKNGIKFPIQNGEISNIFIKNSLPQTGIVKALQNLGYTLIYENKKPHLEEGWRFVINKNSERKGSYKYDSGNEQVLLITGKNMPTHIQLF